MEDFLELFIIFINYNAFRICNEVTKYVLT